MKKAYKDAQNKIVLCTDGFGASRGVFIYIIPKFI